MRPAGSVAGMGHDHGHGPAAAASADRRVARAAAISLAVAVLVLAAKTSAWVVTGSATILSDALESVVHIGATLFMAWCARIATAPPDADHPYGHGRAEHLSAGFEGGAVALAALGIAVVAVESWWTGRSPVELGWGLGLIAAAAAVNAVLGAWLLREGRRLGSPLLIADGQHVLSDVWTSVGVLAGVATMWLVADERLRGLLDACLALALAGYVLWVAVRLVRGAVSGLMDEADPALLARVVGSLGEHRRPGWLDVHDLKVRRAGRHVHVDLHLVVPHHWTVAQAHDEAELLEGALLRDLGQPGTVMVHLDHDGAPAYAELAGQPAPITLASATRPEGGPR